MRRTHRVLATAAGSRAARPSGGEIAVVLGVSTTLFVLQAWHLAFAVSPGTDEGVFAVAGRFLWNGRLPYRDFPFWHMPLLPALIGGGLTLGVGMYPLRLAYLACNCASLVPLYLLLRRVMPRRAGVVAGALAAIGVYATFHAMVYVDFRFLAVRQLANIAFILFVLAGLADAEAQVEAGRPSRRRWLFALQGGLALAATFSFLPALMNVALASAALVWRAGAPERRSTARWYCGVLAVPVLAALAFFASTPGAFAQVVLDQAHRPGDGRLLRFALPLHQRQDAVLLVVGAAGAVSSLWLGRGVRELGAASLLMIAGAVWLPANYFRHYPVAAAPALAFGVCAAVVSLAQLLESRTHAPAAAPHHGGASVRSIVVPLGVTVLLTGHLWAATPSLLREWTRNRQPAYAAFVRAVAAAPDPILILEPIVAVDAEKEPVLEAWPGFMRPPVRVPAWSEADWRVLETRICAAVLSGRFVPDAVRERWLRTYGVAADSPWGVLVLMTNEGCDAGGRSDEPRR